MLAGGSKKDMFGTAGLIIFNDRRDKIKTTGILISMRIFTTPYALISSIYRIVVESASPLPNALYSNMKARPPQ